MNLPRADHELSDDEITERFGDLFAEASSAFRTDPSLMVEMVEAAATLVERREHLPEEPEEAKPSRATSSRFYGDLYDARLSEMSQQGLTRRRMAEVLGVSKNWVTKRLRILEVEKASVASSRAVGDKYDDLITGLRSDGATLHEIAAEVGLTAAWVGKRLQRLKVPDPNRTRPSTEIELHQMAALRRKGWSYNKLGEKFNVPTPTLRSRLLKFEASRSRN